MNRLESRFLQGSASRTANSPTVTALDAASFAHATASSSSTLSGRNSNAHLQPQRLNSDTALHQRSSADDDIDHALADCSATFGAQYQATRNQATRKNNTNNANHTNTNTTTTTTTNNNNTNNNDQSLLAFGICTKKKNTQLRPETLKHSEYIWFFVKT